MRGGLQTLAYALTAHLSHRHPGQIITGLTRTDAGRYQVQTAGGQFAKNEYDVVALALPTYAAAPLLAPLFPEAAAALAAVYYPPMAAIYSAYHRADVTHPLDGFGALHPKVEQPYAAGSIWTSSIFPGRCPADQVLFTTFVGGSQYAAQASESAEEQKAAVHAELSRLYGIKRPHPCGSTSTTGSKAIPQFDSNIVAAHEAADILTAHGIEAVANWRAGVGVPDCVAMPGKWQKK